jgi:predicted amidohydrolase YtcJ
VFQTNLSRLPTRYDLDEVVPDTPVFLWRACWHIGVANTAALRKGGIDLSRTSFDIPGGEVQVTPSGPTGETSSLSLHPLPRVPLNLLTCP